MLLALAPFGSPDLKLDNLGDLNVDVAFQLALPYFLDQHLQFGEQVIFTYGPWGILIAPFTGETWYVAAMLFRIALVTCVFLALSVLADRFSSPGGRAVGWGGAIALVLLWATGQRDSYFLAPALLVAYQRWTVAEDNGASPARQAQAVLWFALSFLSGWAALVKFNIFVVATIAYMLLGADDVIRKRWPVQPLIYGAALVSAWLSAGQDIAHLPLWVLRSLDLSIGYADAMSKGFLRPYGAGLVAAYYCAVALVVIAAISATALQAWKVPALLSLAFTCFLCVVSIKHGVGGNQLEQSLALMVVVLWFVAQLLLIPKQQRDDQALHLWRRLGIGAGVAALLCLVVVAAGANFPIISPRDALADVRGNAALLARVLRGNATDRWEEMLTRTHRFWRPVDIPGTRTIDVFPQHTGVIIGREGLRYSPRPAFLSLNAHTFSLALFNARHFEGSSAPDLVLFQVLPSERSVNNRHPALADGPSWPLLLSRYAPETVDDEFVLLKKRPRSLGINRKVLVDMSLGLGEALYIPQHAGRLLWAEVEVDRTIAGTIIHAIYKSPHVVLESRTADNSTHAFQIVPGLGKAGFLISPLVQTNAAFAELFRGKGAPSDRVVQSIRILSPEAPAFFWERSVRLKLWTLRVDNIGD